MSNYLREISMKLQKREVYKKGGMNTAGFVQIGGQSQLAGRLQLKSSFLCPSEERKSNDIVASFDIDDHLCGIQIRATVEKLNNHHNHENITVP